MQHAESEEDIAVGIGRYAAGKLLAFLQISFIPFQSLSCQTQCVTASTLAAGSLGVGGLQNALIGRRL